MKQVYLLVVLCGSLLVGCATDKALPPTTSTAAIDHQSHTKAAVTLDANQARCADVSIAPSMACSDTVTASFDNKGTLWLAWVQRDRIYVQSSQDKGLHYSEPVAVNAEPMSIAAHDEYRPKIAVDGQGGVYLSWTQNLAKRHTGHIRFSRSTDGGQHFSAPVIVNDNLDEIGHRFDSLLVGQNGELLVTWLDSRDREKAKVANEPFKGTAVYFSTSLDGGVHFSPNQALALHSCECCRIATALDADHLPVVLWRHVFDGTTRDHALIAFSDWQTPGPIQRVGDENWKIDACPHHGGALSIASDGVYHATWFSGAADKQGLFYGHSKDRGQHFSPPFRFGGVGAKHPHVLSLGQRVGLVWTEFDGSRNQAKALLSVDGGVTWSPPRVLASTAAKADEAFLVADGARMLLSWQTGEGFQLLELQ